MSPFVFRGAYEDCQSVEIVPTFVHPLGTADIRALEADDSSALEMELAADEAIVDGEKKVGLVKLKANITFNKPVLVYALVQGGWLPLPFAIPSRFLVDRNVVILLRKIHEERSRQTPNPFDGGPSFFRTIQQYSILCRLPSKPVFAENRLWWSLCLLMTREQRNCFVPYQTATSSSLRIQITDWHTPS